MAGFENQVMLANNVNFDQTAAKPHLGIINAAGKLPIGTGNTFPTPEILGGSLTSPSNSITIGYASPNITLDVNNAIVGETITGDSGGPLSPSSGNWNILGRSGSKTAGSLSTLTVRSPPYADQGGSTTVTLNSGSFATAAITLTTPATAGLLDGDVIEFVATNGILVIQLAATQVAHIGNLATSAAGSFTSTASGDSVKFRYQASTNDWWALNSQGNWVPA